MIGLLDPLGPLDPRLTDTPKKKNKFPPKMRDRRVTGNTEFFLSALCPYTGHISCKGGGQNYLEKLVGDDGEDEPLEKPLHSTFTYCKEHPYSL